MLALARYSLCGSHITYDQKYGNGYSYAKCTDCKRKPCGNCNRRLMFWQDGNITCCDAKGLTKSINLIREDGLVLFWQKRVNPDSNNVL